MKITFLKEFYSMMSSMTSFMDSSRKESFLDSLYSDEIFLDKTKGEYETIPGVNILDIYSQKNPDSSNSFVIKYSFDNISVLGSALDKAVDDGSKKENTAIVTMEKEGDEIVFNYLHEQSLPEGAPDTDSLTEQMKAGIAEMFGNGFVNFEIEFPYEVISSNATSTSGNTLTWYYPMTEVFLQDKMDLVAKMK